MMPTPEKPGWQVPRPAVPIIRSPEPAAPASARQPGQEVSPDTPVVATPPAGSAAEPKKQAIVLALQARRRGTGSRRPLDGWNRAPNVSQPGKENVANSHSPPTHYPTRKDGAERMDREVRYQAPRQETAGGPFSCLFSRFWIISGWSPGLLQLRSGILHHARMRLLVPPLFHGQTNAGGLVECLFVFA